MAINSDGTVAEVWCAEKRTAWRGREAVDRRPVVHPRLSEHTIVGHAEQVSTGLSPGHLITVLPTTGKSTSPEGAHVTRCGIVVRPAERDDLDAVARLVDLVVPTMPGPRQAAARTGTGAERFGRLLDDPDTQMLVACLADGTRAGAAMLSVDAVSIALGGLIMSVVLIVDEDARQRGVGRELVSAVARYADEAGADAVTVSLPSSNREAHRFYSRLGFVPLATNRIASVSQLMRALAPSEIAAERRQSVLLRARRPFRRRSAALADARMAATVWVDRPVG